MRCWGRYSRSTLTTVVPLLSIIQRYQVRGVRPRFRLTDRVLRRFLACVPAWPWDTGLPGLSTHFLLPSTLPPSHTEPEIKIKIGFAADHRYIRGTHATVGGQGRTAGSSTRQPSVPVPARSRVVSNERMSAQRGTHPHRHPRSKKTRRACAHLLAGPVLHLLGAEPLS